MTVPPVGVLRRLADGLHVVDAPLRVLGMRFGARMTVVRLRDGGLLLLSPVPLDDALDGALRTLGPVTAIVAPNTMHHLWAAAAHARHPQARLFAPPALRAKRPDAGWTDVLGDAPDPAWAADVEQLAVAGVPTLDERVFLHRASRTLVVTDLAFNFRDVPHAWTRWLMTLNGAYGRLAQSRIFHRLVRDRAALAGSLERILALDFDRLVPAHGAIVERDARVALAAATAWVRET